MSERWKVVDGFPDYEVSTAGNLRVTRGGVARAIRPCPEQGSGRLAVWLTNDRHRAMLGVARLVLTAFDRPPRAGEVPVYRDGDIRNCRRANLRWGTRVDARRAKPPVPDRRMTAEQRDAARALRAAGRSINEIAAAVGAGRTAVWRATRKE